MNWPMTLAIFGIASPACKRTDWGGGAQASTVLSSAQQIYEYFKSKGGDVEKATVSTTSDNKVQVTDGSTCVECDAAGNCTECSYKP